MAPERLEALAPEELLSEGALPGREYLPKIILEDFWRGRDDQYEKLVSNIARRRAKIAPDVQIDDFDSSLQNTIDSKVYENAFRALNKKIDETYSQTKKFDIWKAKTKSMMGTFRDKAIAIRGLEILINREMLASQKTLVDFPISEKVLQERTSSSVDAAADWFLSREFKIPYYFGFYRLARLSSSNIEQFLAMSADLFEELVSESLIRKVSTLSALRQEDMLKNIARLRWDEIPRTMANGRDIQKFLNSIQELCVAESLRPNAPYSPRVTGIAISMYERDQLIKAVEKKDNSRYAKMTRTIALCISNNLLEPSLDRKQGKKGGKTWMILYLNRILCLQFGLPLQYGGYRQKTLDQIWYYIEQGYRPGRTINRKINNKIGSEWQL